MYMPGGAIQMAARGAQDAYLTGDAGQSFWRQRYNRHANFAVESIDQNLQGQVGYGQRVSCSLSRVGDLLLGLTLEVTLRRGAGPTFYPAEHLIKEVVVEIGGQRIDAVTNTWLRLHDELHRDFDAREAHKRMTDFDKDVVLDKDQAAGSVKRFYVPVPLWFNDAPLPLVALQYHDVVVHVTLERAANVPGIDPSFTPDVALWADYAFLDADERRRFTQAAHEYLVEQTQVLREPVRVLPATRTYAVDLPFGHPIKYIAWVLKPGAASHGLFSARLQGAESNEACGPLAECGLQLNGQDRFAPRKGAFFRLFHPANAFGQAPSVGVYAYSFALRPGAAAPSGTLNCSRLETARLVLTTKAATRATVADVRGEADTLVSATALDMLEVYARNYNVLRVRDGMAALAYVN